jgi:hypothetical protein
MLVSYTTASGLLFTIVRSTSTAWDYAVTISAVHFVLCCLGKCVSAALRQLGDEPIYHSAWPVFAHT